MKNLNSSASLLFLCEFVLGGEFDHTIYDQYRIAPLRYSYPQLRLDYRLEHGKTDENYWQGDSVDYDSKNLYSDLDLKGHYYIYFESEKRVRSIVLYSKIRSDLNDRETITDREDNSEQRTKSFAYSYDYAEIFYLGPNNWHLGFEGGISGIRASNHGINESIRETSENYNNVKTTQAYQEHDVALTVGKGRVRNVTGIHRALQMLDRLEEQGVDVPEISPEDVVRIAQALDSRDKYSRLFYRSGKVYWQHVASMFDSLGISLNDLDVYSTLYLTESVALLHHPRYTGSRWKLGTRIQYRKDLRETSRFNKSDSLLSENELWDESIYLLINPSYLWHRPLSLKASVSFSADLLAGPAIGKRSEYNQQYSLNLSSKYQYDISDRLMTSIEGSYGYSRWNYNSNYNDSRWNPEFDVLKHQFNIYSSFKYYIFDYAHVDMSYAYGISSNRYDERELPPNENYYNGTFRITLTYGPRSPSIY